MTFTNYIVAIHRNDGVIELLGTLYDSEKEADVQGKYWRTHMKNVKAVTVETVTLDVKERA